LRDRAGDAKLSELVRQSRGPFFKRVFVDALLVVGRTQQCGVRQLVGVDAAPRDLWRRRAAGGDGRALLVQSPSPHHRYGFRGKRYFGFASAGVGDACAKTGALAPRRRVLGTPFGFRFGGFRFGLARQDNAPSQPLYHHGLLPRHLGPFHFASQALAFARLAPSLRARHQSFHESKVSPEKPEGGGERKSSDQEERAQEDGARHDDGAHTVKDADEPKGENIP